MIAYRGKSRDISRGVANRGGNYVAVRPRPRPKKHPAKIYDAVIALHCRSFFLFSFFFVFVLVFSCVRSFICFSTRSKTRDTNHFAREEKERLKNVVRILITRSENFGSTRECSDKKITSNRSCPIIAEWNRRIIPDYTRILPTRSEIYSFSRNSFEISDERGWRSGLAKTWPRNYARRKLWFRSYGEISSDEEVH